MFVNLIRLSGRHAREDLRQVYAITHAPMHSQAVTYLCEGKAMQTTFQASDGGQAVIQNTTKVDSEQLVVTLHPGADSSVDFQIRENVVGTNGGDLISSSISINQTNLQKLVDWLREQGAVD
jgi:hypothetical protein